jgi:uncharacterized protein YecT (DUF1311 family)
MRTLWLLSALVASPAFAQDYDCTTTEIQQEMNACAEEDWLAADEYLNEAYKVAMEAMKDIDADLPKAEQGAAVNLRNGQRAWITYRDATCAAEGYAMHGGSAEPLLIYGCRARLTAVRSEELQNMVESY